jgi:hypothetical protein
MARACVRQVLDVPARARNGFVVDPPRARIERRTFSRALERTATGRPR